MTPNSPEPVARTPVRSTVVVDPDAVTVEPGDPAAGQVEPREPGVPRADRVHDHAAEQRQADAGLDVVQVQRPGDPGVLDPHAAGVQRAAETEQQLAKHQRPHRGAGREGKAAPGGFHQPPLRLGQLVEDGQRREVGHRTNQPGGRSASSSRSA